MTAFTTKSYQQDVLNSTKAYFERIHEFGKASTAFTIVTDELWAEMSEGRCLFVMVKEKHWEPIDALLPPIDKSV